MVAQLTRPVVAAILRLLSALGRGKGQRIATDLAKRLPPAMYATSRVRARRSGFDLDLDLADNPQRYLYFVGAYEPRFGAFLREELRAGDVYVDVGAHIGIHALAAARQLAALGSGRVICFEASPDTARVLREHARRNSVAIELHEVALLDEPGTIELRGDPRFGRDEVSVRSAFGPGDVLVEAPAVRFDDWADEHDIDRIDVVKLDIEGAELHALRGMARSLERCRPRVVAVELKDYLLEQAGTSKAEVIEFLRSIGYESTGRRIDENVIFRPSS